MRFLAPVLACVFIAACGGGDDSAAAPNEPARGTYTVTLRSGEPAVISQESLTLQLTEVQDSRCPIDAVCIWAGHASVTLNVAQAGQPGVSLHVGLPVPVDPKLPGEATYRGYRLSLQALDPAPRAAVTVPLEQYRATLRVERAQ